MKFPFLPKVIVAAILLIGVGVDRPHAQAPRGTQSQGADVMAVQAVTYCFADTIDVTGYLVPRQEAVVNLDDGYRVAEPLVKEGATVTSNQELVRLTRLDVPGVPRPPGPATVVLHAPAAGVVTRSTAMVGAVASPMAEPLYRIMIDGEIELEVEVPSIHVPKLRADGRQTARVGVENGTELSGRVRLVPGEI